MTPFPVACPHKRVIETGHRVEKDRQPDGSVRRRCFVVARCRACGQKMVQEYDMRRRGDWGAVDEDARDTEREAS